MIDRSRRCASRNRSYLRFLPLLALPLALLAGTCASAQAQVSSNPVFATYKFADEKSVRVFVIDPETVSQLQDILAGKMGDKIPNGRLIDDRPGHSPYDAQWSWHFRPESLKLADVTIEVCDGTPSYIEEHMDDWFRGEKEAQWCSWASHLTGLDPLLSGDVNLDNKVNIADAQAAVTALIGTKPLNEAAFIAADIFPAASPANGNKTGDGSVDLRDVISLLRKSLGLTA